MSLEWSAVALRHEIWVDQEIYEKCFHLENILFCNLKVVTLCLGKYKGRFYVYFVLTRYVYTYMYTHIGLDIWIWNSFFKKDPVSQMSWI